MWFGFVISRGIGLSTCCAQDIPSCSNISAEQKHDQGRCYYWLASEAACWMAAVERRHIGNPLFNNLSFQWVRGVPFPYFAEKSPLSLVHCWVMHSSCHAVIQLSFPRNSCLQNFSFMQRCVWNALVNETVKCIPYLFIGSLVWDGLLVCHKALCMSSAYKLKRKCLFSLCKYHFFNVGEFLHNSCYSLWRS